MKTVIKKLFPKSVLNLRHLFYAWWGSVKYKHPSEELFVIGITGTSGKSTTTTLLRQTLEEAGYIVGSLSTIDFYVAGERKLNDKKMTMLGKTAIQRYLREMVDKKCDIAIVETTSEGRVQHRHRFINYDALLFTNLYPEHIESHGSFEKYKKAKEDICAYIARSKRKHVSALKTTKVLPFFLDEETQTVRKSAVVQEGVLSQADIFRFPFDEKAKFCVRDQGVPCFGESDGVFFLEAKIESVSDKGISFVTGGDTYLAPMFGEYNVSNIANVIAFAKIAGLEYQDVNKAVSQFRNVDGRLELISEAEQYGFQVIVDYAFEPRALTGLYTVVDLISPKRIIHVTGNTGGGRDKPDAKAKLIAEKADIVIVTNEDPYDDDPMDIINGMSDIVAQHGKKDGETLFRVLERRDGIAKAISLAQEGDMVLVTGKGSEQAMVVRGELVPWDDRQVVRDVLKNKLSS